ESYRPGGVRSRDLPRLYGLVGVCRAQQRKIRKRAEACQLFHRLMRRSVLAQSDAVVGPYIDDVGLAQGRQSDAWSHVVGKRKEGGGKGQDAAMQGHARGNPGHRVLANTEMNIPPGISGRTAYQSLSRR